MRQSQLFTKTQKEKPKDAASANAELLERGGFVYKNSAGIYSFLPLGFRVMQKISTIIREEINAIGGQELLMPALIEKKYMEPTNRWNLDVGFFTSDAESKEPNFVLGWSHEEVLTAIATQYISSYKDLPFAAYQIQTKFRNEARAKSGILRGKEFIMKDLYSFHASQQDLLAYYEKVKQAYFKIFNRCGLKSIYTLAAGGVFTTNFTHEFQVLSEVGEDTIMLCEECGYAENIEISKLKEGDICSIRPTGKQACKGIVVEKTSIEVGNIFNQGTKYSENLGLYFADEQGAKNPVWMASYGIGTSRVMGVIVEAHHDGKGIVWPKEIAPYTAHLVELNSNNIKVKTTATDLYEKLIGEGVEVLYDDREEKTAGEKFADADLLGIPLRIVVSERTLEKNSVEIKKRNEEQNKLMNISQAFNVTRYTIHDL